MVFNPPVLRPAPGDEPQDVPTVTISQKRDKEAYVEQAQRALVWCSVHFIGWLLTRLTCEYDFPPDCNLPMTGLEVLTDLITLLTFGFTQAWFCEVLEERRFRHLYQQLYFAPVFIFTGLILSVLETSTFWKELRTLPNEEFDSGHVAFSIITAAIVILFVMWHFAEAWRILPGAYYVSGNVPVKIVIEDNLHRVYNVSRGLIVVWVLMYAAFAYGDNQGWELHYVLIAWALSLLAQFKARPSIVFLAITSAVFVQGVGSYGVEFLCNNNITPAQASE